MCVVISFFEVVRIHSLRALQRAESHEQCREAQIKNEPSERWYDYDSPLEAYLAEDYEVLYDMECELNKHGSDEDQL